MLTDYIAPLVCMLADIWYFYVTGTLIIHGTLISCIYFLFQEHSYNRIIYSGILLGITGLIIFHSYTIYYLSCLPWAVGAYLIRHYMGRKDFYICSFVIVALFTHTLLLYFSIFKLWITPFYTFKVIICNLIVTYMVVLKFPIVEHGNRL